MLNITAAGRLGGDPEVKMSRNNKPYCKFTVACKTGWDKEKNQEKTEWLSCTAFGKTGEAISAHMHKGDQIIIDRAVLETHDYEKDGVKHRFTGIIVFSFEFGAKAGGARKEASHEEPSSVPF